MNYNNTNMTLASGGTKTARFGKKTARLYFFAALGVALIGLAGVAILTGTGDSAAPSAVSGGVLPLPGGASQAETLAPLQGEAALTHLREQGQYESLAAAMETARYGVRPAAGAETFGAANERQRFHAAFTSAGLTLAAPGGSDWRLGISLRGVGYGTADQPLGPATLSAVGQRVELLRQMPTRGSVTEWYVNRPSGLEQGFTLSEAPGERRAGEPLTLSLELSDGWRAAVEPDGQSARLSSTGGVHLQYDKLLVTDAAGRQLEARMATAGDGTVRLEVADEGAQYPVTIDPTFTQQAYLKASNTGVEDRFGNSIAISGETVVVGAHREDSNATGVNGDQGNNSAVDSGAAYVFTRSGTTWSQQAYLKASNTGADDLFGLAVAVSGDTVVVGANRESSNATGVNGNQTNNSANASGAAYVFTRSGTIWTQQAYLKASNTGADDQFGISVAVSGDTVVVGADSEASNATGINGDQGNNDAFFSGAAYVFTRSGTTWSQQAYLKASNTGAFDLFGYAVAVSGDTVVVGAYFEDSNATGVNGDQVNNGAFDSGAAYIFTRSGTTWSQQAYLKASNTGAGDQFGRAIALSGDTVVVGANREASNATGVNGDQGANNAADSGAAYVFTRSGTTWTLQAYLKASNTGLADLFGWLVAVSGDTLVVGAIGEDSNATSVNGDQGNNSAADSGDAYVFTRSGTTWTQQAYLKASNTGLADLFGWSAAVSGDTVVVGGVAEDSNATGVNGDQTNNSATDSGAVYVFAVPPTPTLGTYPATTVDLSGNVTVTPSAAPTNTTSISVAAPTSFIGELTADPVTGVVRVTNAHLARLPAGAYPVTVTAFGPGGTTTATFNVTITTTACAFTSGFISAPDVAVGTSPLSVAVGDFNGDGKQDIAFIDFSGSLAFVQIRLGDGIGGFSGTTNVSVGNFSISAVAVGDFNGDGKQDIAASSFGLDTVAIRLGDGLGGLIGTTNVGVGDGPTSVAVGDFNGDGKQDIAVANRLSNSVSIRLGDGSGGFSGTTNVTVGTIPFSVAVGDFNGDGKQDIAAANTGADTVSIRLGDGAGGFSGTTTVAVGSRPQSVAVGDFNGDGNQDIVTANNGVNATNFSGTVSIRHGDGAGGFSGTTDIGVGRETRSVAVGDFNGDGRQDFAATNQLSNNVSIRVGTCAPPPPATFTVTNLLDSGPGSLRQAILNANANSPAADTINFQAGLTGTITLTSGQMIVSDSLTINGPGASVISVSGNNASRIFQFASGQTVSLSGLTLTGGKSIGALDDGIGGAVLSYATATISNVVVYGNSAGVGGGVANVGTMTLSNSVVANNSASNGGGGLYSFNALTTITDSTFSGNTASFQGGALYLVESSATLVNSTISGNTANSETLPGAIAFVATTVSQTLRVVNSTIANNMTGTPNTVGGILVFGGNPGAATLTLRNSIIANNGSINLLAFRSGGRMSTITSQGYNLISDNGAGFLTGTGDQINTNPLLGPLANNGGPTPTHALLAGSPALDKGSNAGSGVTTDQRGLTRPRDLLAANAAGGDGSDIGAYEEQIDPQVVISGSVQTSNAPNAGTPVAGVRIDLTGSSTQVTMTDAGGNYSFTVPRGGDYTVTPSGQGRTYEPLSRSFTNVQANITNANFTAFGPGTLERNLRVDTSYVMSPGPVSVPVVLTAIGNERKVSFSLSYDTARLGSPVVTCGQDAAGCVVIQDNSVPGAVGIMVTFATLPAPGERRIVTVTFAANSGGNANTPVLFTDMPTNLFTIDSAGDPLATGYTGGFVVFTATGLEGDLATRFTGDGVYRSNDVEQERRFVAGIDTPNPVTNELERADVAPYETRGDGRLRADDFQLVKNYVANLVAPQSAGGPDQLVSASPVHERASKQTGRTLRIVPVHDSIERAEGKTSVAVEIDSLGDETVALFSLNFDASILSNPVIALAEGEMPGGTSLTANTTRVAEGSLTILIDSPTPFKTAYAQRLVVITFDVAKDAPASETAITFDDSGSLSDAAARLLDAVFEDGAIVIHGRATSGRFHVVP